MSIFDFETVFRAFRLSVDLYASLRVFGLSVASSGVLPRFSHYIKKPVLLMACTQKLAFTYLSTQSMKS